MRHGESRAQELGILGGHAGCQGLSTLGRRRWRPSATGWRRRASWRRRHGALLVGDAAGGRDGRRSSPRPSAGSRCGPSATSARATPARPTGSPGTSWPSATRRPTGGTPTQPRSPAGRPGGRWGSACSARSTSLVERHPGETVVVACHGGVVVQSMLHCLALDEVATDRRAWMSPRQHVAHRVAVRAATRTRRARCRWSWSASTTTPTWRHASR